MSLLLPTKVVGSNLFKNYRCKINRKNRRINVETYRPIAAIKQQDPCALQ